ncbi:serine-rich adhesin for platelets-like isoform X1 [Sebastes umbrosus]|uniref:serine-rich adhesin for platelets-like isoform X1 n=1 Tax=Sebastes umbrosus TaxID=72105 RepID=UPI0018A06243|nr:serine-rich adhesin for platelets-like isoform X1 [Sebastes umbrosus]
MSSGQSLGGLDASMRWLNEESLPDSTLFDVTCEPALPATPVTAGSVKSRFTFLQTSQLSSSTNLNTTGQTPCPQKKTLDLLQSNVSSPKAENETFDTKLSVQNGTKTFSETSSSDTSSDKENNSEVHSPGLPKHNWKTASTDPDDMMVDPPENMYAPELWMDFQRSPEITLLDVTRDPELPQGEELSTMYTQGSVFENSRPLLEPSEPNTVKIQTSADDTFGTHPANFTHDISSSSDKSVQCAASQSSISDVQCNTSSKTVTSELHGEPVLTSNAVEANSEEPLSSHDAESTSKEPQPSPKTSESVNNTFTSLQPSQLSSSADSNTTAQNKTLDVSPSNVNSPKAESEATDQAISVSNNSTETSLVINQNSSAVKAGGSCDMQNATFDRHSLQKSSANTILGDAGAATFCLQNNTFDTKPPSKQNGTITLSETDSSDSHQNTFDKPSPLKGCNATSSPKENNSEVHPPEVSKHNGTPASTDPNAKTADTPESTFEVNPAGETQGLSQSCLPLTDGLSDNSESILTNQNMDTEDNKANTFDPLITSTPMISCKIVNFNTQREEGKIIVAQKKLYGDGPSKPDGQVPSDVPSNIACDRKTFLTQPAAKSLLPPPKAASQLLRHKPASALPGRFEMLTSGLPMTRQRTQAEALRNTTAPDTLQTSGISSSYKLRATTTGSKQTNPGLQRPRLSSMPSGIQRAATGLRPPSLRSNTQAASSTNKLNGPTAATNPVMRTSQAKKQPLTRGEAFPIAKRKKMDTTLPPSCAEFSITSCDAANGSKNLKPAIATKRALPAKTQRDNAAVPASTAAEISTSCDVSRARALKQPATSHRAQLAKPRGHGCANCVVLEQQLKMQSEEIRRLKEELLEKSKQEEDLYF